MRSYITGQQAGVPSLSGETSPVSLFSGKLFADPPSKFISMTRTLTTADPHAEVRIYRHLSSKVLIENFGTYTAFDEFDGHMLKNLERFRFKKSRPNSVRNANQELGTCGNERAPSTWHGIAGIEEVWALGLLSSVLLTCMRKATLSELLSLTSQG